MLATNAGLLTPILGDPSPWTPQRLYINGEAGAWYDPGDLTAEKVAWRRNLLTWSEDFTNSAWNKISATVTANAGVAPDGTTTADLLVPTVTNNGYAQQLVDVTAGQVMIISAYVKASALTSVIIDMGSSFGSRGMTVNLSTGAITSSTTGLLAFFSTAVGNGWYRIGYAKASSGTGVGGFALLPQGTANGTDGVLVWGAQVEVGSAASAYQRITNFTSDFLAAFPTHALFQDSAGTTPVTALGQPVGLVLDKSRGALGSLGPELVTNGSFASGTTGWTAEGTNTIAVVNGELEVTLNTAAFTGAAGTAYTLVVGSTYRVTATARLGTTASNITVRFGSSSGEGDITFSSTTRTTVTRYFTATTASITPRVLTVASTGTGTFYVDDLSVKLVPGNHAIQPTSASRPLLDARVNLLTYSEQLNNAAWAKINSVTVTADSTTAPDGTTTADTLNVNSTGADRTLRRSPAGLYAGAAMQAWVYAKKNASNFVYIRFYDSGSPTVWFNLNTGAVGTQQTGVTGTITDAGNGWYLCKASRTIAGTIAYNEMDIGVCDANGSTTATLGGSIYLWGADLRLASNAAYPYQRVVTATDYADVGVPRSFLHDGFDDSSYTASSLDLSGTDKVTVWAGVYKNSDAGAGAVVELTTNVSANNGSFFMDAPDDIGANGDFAFYSKGTALRGADSAATLAPVSRVMTGIGDISGDVATLRLNGVQAATNTGDQGTGNYSNAVLYMGRRNNASLPFNGKIYTIIIRGGVTDAATLALTERYVGSRMGIVL